MQGTIGVEEGRGAASFALPITCLFFLRTFVNEMLVGASAEERV